MDTKKSTAAWVLEFASYRKVEYILSVLFALVGVICGLMPYFIMIDLFKELLSNNIDKAWYINKCLIMGLWWLARYILHSISTTLSHHATFNVLAIIRERLLAKLASLPLGTVLENSSGSYKNIIVERVDAIETTLAHMIPEISGNFIGAIIMLVMIFIIDWRMGLAMLIVLPLGGACFSMMFKDYEASYSNTIVKTKALNDTAVEYINGIEVIKAFGQDKKSYEKFTIAAKEGADCFIDWMRNCLFGQTGSMTILPATLIGVIPVGCLLYKNGSLSAVDFLSVIIMSFGVMQPIMTVTSYTDDLQQVQYIFEEITSILDKKDLDRPIKAKQLPKDNSIVLNDVHFGYNDKEVLHGISLTIKPGSVNALVGPSGSGKSTIAKLIASLWNPDKGSITLGGVDLKDLPLQDCVNYIAYVSQENYLFDMSIMENIRLGKKDASDNEAIEACKKCGCHEFIESLENGYDTICGSSGTHLSGGEKQRICIARAMLKDAPIVILDEATSYTDPENEALIQSCLASLIKGKTLLVIAHRLSTISNADCIFVVNDGNIIASGSHRQLLESCDLYSNMWQAHMSVKDNCEVIKHA